MPGGVPQETVLSLIINDLDVGLVQVYKFSGDTKLGKVADTLEARDRIQNDMNRLENGPQLIR